MCMKQSRRSLGTRVSFLAGKNRSWMCFTKVNDELNNLETRDPFLPPYANTPCALEVVPVHHYMDQKVKSNGDPGNWC